MEKISVEQAKKLDQIEKKLIREFKEQIRIDDEYDQVRQKTFEPITSAIGKVEEKLENFNTQQQQIVPVRSSFDASFEDEEVFLPTSTPFRPIRAKSVIEESTMVQPESPRTPNIVIGPLGKKYLPRALDKNYGLFWDKHRKTYMIGDKTVDFDFNDIIIDSQKYKGTQGLWRLLTYNKTPDDHLFDQTDLENYSKILFDSNAIFKNNDPDTRKVKSNRSDKYVNLVKKIWDSRKDFEGSGIRKYSEDHVEYRYINDLNELIKRMNFIYAKEKAGHNNFLNEKKAIKDFISNLLDKAIEKPEGIKYLLRILPALNSPMLKEGSGFLNNLINNLPFELHVPGYQFLGPGTRLEKRLARGDQGINDLDRAAMEHDKFYRDNKDTKSRNDIADKVLQNKAWDIALSSDHDIGQRLVAVPTAGAMWLKRKFGMGLDEENFSYNKWSQPMLL